jgi:hypothetical protein
LAGILRKTARFDNGRHRISPEKSRDFRMLRIH